MKSDEKSAKKILQDIIEPLKKHEYHAGDPNIVFISGGITNDPDYKKHFAAAAEKLQKIGYVVINPSFLPIGMVHDAYMPICYSMIDQSGTVCFLEGWVNSEGSKYEMLYTLKNNNKKIIFECDLL